MYIYFRTRARTHTHTHTHSTLNAFASEKRTRTTIPRASPLARSENSKVLATIGRKMGRLPNAHEFWRSAMGVAVIRRVRRDLLCVSKETYQCQKRPGEGP